MMDNIDEVADKWLIALKYIENDMLREAWPYKKGEVEWPYKKVKLKSLQVGDLIWKVILQIGSNDIKIGKWSLS
jgi:hypothetical protein